MSVSDKKAIRCPRCNRRWSVDISALNACVQCPDCKLDFLPKAVSEANAVPENDSASENDSDEYGFAEPTPPPPMPRAAPVLETHEEEDDDLVVVEDGEDYESEAAELVKKSSKSRAFILWEPTGNAPPDLFTKGFGAYLMRPSTILSAAVLGFCAAGVVFLAASAGAGAVPTGGGSAGAADLWDEIVSFASFLFAIVGAGAFVAVASIIGIIILCDLSVGKPKVENWQQSFSDYWLAGPYYFFGALLWALVPGGVFGMILPKSANAIVFVLGFAVVFPLALLASFEAQTPFRPGAVEVWRSVFKAPKAWFRFFYVTFSLAIGVAVTVWACLGATRTKLFIVGAVVGYGWMIYLWTIGRLTWFCSGKWGQDQKELAEQNGAGGDGAKETPDSPKAFPKGDYMLGG